MRLQLVSLRLLGQGPGAEQLGWRSDVKFGAPHHRTRRYVYICSESMVGTIRRLQMKLLGPLVKFLCGLVVAALGGCGGSSDASMTVAYPAGTIDSGNPGAVSALVQKMRQRGIRVGTVKCSEVQAFNDDGSGAVFPGFARLVVGLIEVNAGDLAEVSKMIEAHDPPGVLIYDGIRLRAVGEPFSCDNAPGW